MLVTAIYLLTWKNPKLCENTNVHMMELQNLSIQRFVVLGYLAKSKNTTSFMVKQKLFEGSISIAMNIITIIGMPN